MNASSPAPVRTRASRPRGAILVLVLGMIILLSVVVTMFLDLARKELLLRSMYQARDNLRCTAYSALEATLAVLNEYNQLDSGLYAPAQGWGGLVDPELGSNSTGILDQVGDFVAPPGVQVKVVITDESGRLSMANVTDSELNAVLVSLGFQQPLTQTMLDSYDDWVDSDSNARLNGAESETYELRNPPYDPPNRPVQSYEEFRYIQGWDEAFFSDNSDPTLFARFRNMTTLLPTGGTANVNTMPIDLMNAYTLLGQLDTDTVNSLLAGSDAIRGTADDVMIRNSTEMTAAGISATANSSATSGLGSTSALGGASGIGTGSGSGFGTGTSSGFGTGTSSGLGTGGFGGSGASLFKVPHNNLLALAGSVGAPKLAVTMANALAADAVSAAGGGGFGGGGGGTGGGGFGGGGTGGGGTGGGGFGGGGTGGGGFGGGGTGGGGFGGGGTGGGGFGGGGAGGGGFGGGGAGGGGGGGGGRGGAGGGGGGRGGAGGGGGGRGGAGGGGRGGAGGGGRGGAAGGGRGGADAGGRGGAAAGGRGANAGNNAAGGATAGGNAAGGAGNSSGNTTANTSGSALIGYQCALLKIEVTASLGDAHFLLSALVKPLTAGKGVPASYSTGQGGSSTGTTVSATQTTAYPFTFVNIGENFTFD